MTVRGDAASTSTAEMNARVVVVCAASKPDLVKSPGPDTHVVAVPAKWQVQGPVAVGRNRLIDSEFERLCADPDRIAQQGSAGRNDGCWVASEGDSNGWAD